MDSAQRLGEWLELERTGSDAMWQYDPRPDIERLIEQLEIVDKQRLKWERLAVDRGYAVESLQEQFEVYEKALLEVRDRHYATRALPVKIATEALASYPASSPKDQS